MSTVKLDNRERIFKVSDVSTPELLKYYDNNRKGNTYNSSAYDIVFFTKNEDHHGDIYFHDKLYTYFHDIDYSYNTIMNDTFTCRLTRDREYHTLQLTYLTCNVNEVYYDLDSRENKTDKLIFTLNNYVENIIKFDNEKNVELSYNVSYYNAEVNVSENEHIIEVMLSQKNYQTEYKDNFELIYTHNGQNYKYNIPIIGYHTKIPCTTLSISPQYSYLYEGQSMTLSYYYTPKNTTDKFFTYNINISYNPNTTNSLCYDIAYVKCGNQVAYSYIYMREPQIEDIKFYLYSTDTYLKSGMTGKIAMTIYPPELNTYLHSLLPNNLNSVLRLYNIPDNGGSPQEITKISSEDNVLYVPTSFEYTNNDYYEFTSADQYKIRGEISYKGQLKNDEIIYAVGIEPKPCSSISIDPASQTCRSELSTSNISSTVYSLLVIRIYNDLDFRIESHKKCVIKNLQYDFEFGNNITITPYNENGYANGFNISQYRNGYVEKIEFTILNDIENGSETEFTVYANDGSHKSASSNITIESEFITPQFTDNWYIRDITNQTYSNFDGFSLINSNTHVCTLSRHNYDIAIKCTNNPTIIDYVQFGESAMTSGFNCQNCRILTYNSISYVVFSANAKKYLPDNKSVKFFINDKSITISVKNEGSELNSILLNQNNNVIYGINNQNWFNISYDPILAANVTLKSISYSPSLGINVVNTNPNAFPWSYNISFNNLQYNGNTLVDRYTLNVKVRQKIDNTNNYDLETQYSLFIHSRTATLSSSISSIDLSDVPSQTVNFTISDCNIPNMANVYIGMKRDNSQIEYMQYPNTSYTIDNEGVYVFAVYHKVNSTYVKISNEISITAAHNIHYVETVYDIWFEKDKNCVNDEIKLYFSTDTIVNSLNNLLINLNSNNYSVINKSFTGEIIGGRKIVLCTVKSNETNISSLSTKENLTATILNMSKTTTIYPYITSCIVNVSSNLIFENAIDNYNSISISAIYFNRNENIVSSGNTLGAQYTVQYITNIDLGYILGTTFYANRDKVGKFKIEHKIDNSENKYYYSEEVTQYTAPINITGSKSYVHGYPGYEENIIINYTFKSIFNLPQYNQYKNTTGIYYWYGTNESSAIVLEADNINVKTNQGNLHIKCLYSGAQEDITCKCKEITQIFGLNYIYGPGNINKFIQTMKVDVTENNNTSSGQICSLGENYTVSSSVSENVSISFLEGSQYSVPIYSQYEFDKNLGTDEIILHTTVESNSYINNATHSLECNQVLIPAKVIDFSIYNSETLTHSVLSNPEANNIWTASTQVNSNYNSLYNITLNNILNINPNELPAYLFVTEYAKFGDGTCAYSISHHFGQTSEYYNNENGSHTARIANLNTNWNILYNPPFANKGSYTTNVLVLWYDEKINRILPVHHDGIGFTYVGVVPSSNYIYNKVQPLTYYDISNEYFKTKLDPHLLAIYTAEIGEGNNIVEPSIVELTIPLLTIDLSGSNISVSCSDMNKLNNLTQLKIIVRSMNTFPGGYVNSDEINLLNDVNDQTIKNKLLNTFSWYFDTASAGDLQYTMSIVGIKYKLKNNNSGYTKLIIRNILIKYASNAYFTFASCPYNLVSTIIPQLYAKGCKHAPATGWNTFSINQHYTLSTSNENIYTKL